MTGSIKTKTPKFKFIIPQFNIATWHDYIEDNFRAIDALFFNIFDIQNFSGSWTKTTEYKKDQVLFIGEDYEVDETGQLKKNDQGDLIVSEFSGRLVKVLKNHTTDNSDYFSLYYFNHKDEYELFADASTAQNFANLTKQYSENAQQSENNAELYKNSAQGYAQEAENSKNIAQQNAQLATNKAESAASSATIAKNSENSAANSATLAEGYKNDAKGFADSAKSSKDITVENVQTVTNLVQDPNLVAVGTDLRSASSNIKNVSSISEQTKNVSDNMSYIKLVDNNKVNINKAVTNEANINTVADNIDNINITAQNKDNINTVVNYKDAITTISTNINTINNVSENITNIKAVDNNKINIDNVATNKTNINNVSANITAVNNVSKNIADVKNAVQSANDAELWAVGTIAEKPEGSSKYWAKQAQQVAQIYDATETVKGIVRLATSDEVTTGTNNSAAITPLKFKQKIAQDLTNPSADTVPSTKAVSDESSRLESIMSNKIGEITSFVCSSTYIPKGCLPCNGGEYSKEQFKDLWNNYLSDGKLLTCTYTEYANDISTYGQCAKFAIDTANNKFKVPTIKNGSYITQSLSDTELGKSYKESLPNIIGDTGYDDEIVMGRANGPFVSSNNKIKDRVYFGGNRTGTYTIFDASNYSSTYQNGAKVQGDNVRLRFFVVVANGEINQSVMDWSAWVTSLNSKANVTLDNVSPAQSFKEQSVSWVIPDYDRAISIISNSAFVAPFDGIVEIHVEYGSTYGWRFSLGNKDDPNKSIMSGAQSGTQLVISGGQAIISKGQTYYFLVDGTVKRAILCPFKGVN